MEQDSFSATASTTAATAAAAAAATNATSPPVGFTLFRFAVHTYCLLACLHLAFSSHTPPVCWTSIIYLLDLVVSS